MIMKNDLIFGNTLLTTVENIEPLGGTRTD